MKFFKTWLKIHSSHPLFLCTDEIIRLVIPQELGLKDLDVVERIFIYGHHYNDTLLLKPEEYKKYLKILEEERRNP